MEWWESLFKVTKWHGNMETISVICSMLMIVLYNDIYGIFISNMIVTFWKLSNKFCRIVGSLLILSPRFQNTIVCLITEVSPKSSKNFKSVHKVYPFQGTAYIGVCWNSPYASGISLSYTCTNSISHISCISSGWKWKPYLLVFVTVSAWFLCVPLDGNGSSRKINFPYFVF